MFGNFDKHIHFRIKRKKTYTFIFVPNIWTRQQFNRAMNLTHPSTNSTSQVLPIFPIRQHNKRNIIEVKLIFNSVPRLKPGSNEEDTIYKILRTKNLKSNRRPRHRFLTPVIGFDVLTIQRNFHRRQQRLHKQSFSVNTILR